MGMTIEQMRQDAFKRGNFKELDRLEKILFFREYKRKNHKPFCDTSKERVSSKSKRYK